MFHALGKFIHRHRWATLGCAALFLACSVLMLVRGARLTSSSVRNLEAEHADRLVESVIGRRTAMTFVAHFTSSSLDPESQAFGDAMASALEPLRSDPRVAQVESPAAINRDARSALALITLHGELEDGLGAYPSVREALRSSQLEITTTGHIPFIHDLDETLERDLMLAELVSLPLALLVLLLVFRTAVAAILPVGVGALAVLGGIAVIFGLSHLIEVAQFTINVCSLIGLGVAIDYSLIMVSRYREELAAGHSYPDALARALAHAGPVVAFSSLAVVCGLTGLLFFQRSYLVTMGIGGAIVVALAALFALTFLPALLAVLGPKIHALPVPLPRFKVRGGAWHRLAGWVMKRPLWVLIPTLAFLIAVGSPFFRIRLAASDVRVLPAHLEARRGFEQLRAEFPDEAQTHFTVAVAFPSGPVWTKDRIGALYDLSERIAAMPGIRKVRSITSDPRFSREGYQQLLITPPGPLAAQVNAGKQAVSKGSVVFLQAISAEAPESDTARAIVQLIRADRHVADGTLVVGGEAAADVDATDFLVSRAPAAILFVVVTTLIILCLLLGSVLLPIKAVLMNFLSIAGSFGALVFIFQEGHGLVDNARPLEPALPVLLFCVLFGLSMDYEVLILSRMKEAYERSRNNVQAVAEGLEKTGGLVTSSAAIMLAVFLAFGLSQVILIKAVGIGMGIAVALDATLIRVLLVPATMRLMGNANWWCPRWLHALRRWLGLEPPEGDMPDTGTLHAR